MTKENLQNTEEIDLMKLFSIVWKRKYWIIAFLLIVSVVTVFSVTKLENIYESRALLKSSESSSDSSALVGRLGNLASIAGVDLGKSEDISSFDVMATFLDDANFLTAFVKENNFEPYIFSEFEKKKNDPEFLANERFYVKLSLRGNISFSKNNKTGVIALSYRNKNREFTKTLVDKLLLELSARYKKLDLSSTQQQIDNYKSEISKTSDISIKNSLAQIVSGLIQKKIISQAQEYYGFDILVQPAVPDVLEKVAPRRSIICITAFMFAFFFSIMFALIYEYFLKKRK
ncbi:MAG: hypothetical protein C0602_10570 [Denitrovibrio sp.]|nr:MAG: hypothetical protein C0602_10570 [Denitrovibrio sp.]